VAQSLPLRPTVEFISAPVGGPTTPVKVLSKQYKVRRRRRIVTGLLAGLALSAIAMSFVLVKGPAPRRTISDARSSAVRPGAGAPVRKAPVAAPVRPVYRYSVVPGGVRSSEEIAGVIKRDQVVAAHYRGVDPQRMRSERLQQPLLAHVSYRMGDKVYWTKKPVQLPKNEPVMTDGKMMIRERCGNLISMEPLAPASEEEPSLPSFDLLVAPTELAWQRLNLPLVSRPPSRRSGGPTPGSPSLLSGGGPLGASGLRAGESATSPSTQSTGSPNGGPPTGGPPTIDAPPTDPPVDPPIDPRNIDPPIDPRSIDPPTETFTPVETPLPVPEPSTLTLFGLAGATGVAHYLRKRARARN